MAEILIEGKKLFISLPFFERFGIGEKLARKWGTRKIVEKKIYFNRLFISYKTIPEPSRCKLPEFEELIRLAKEGEKDSSVQRVLKTINDGLKHRYGKHYCTIEKKYNLTAEQNQRFARDWSVWEIVMEILDDRPKTTQENVWKALNNQPDLTRHTHKQFANFRRFIKNIKERGIEQMMVEQRSLRVFDTIYDHDLLTTLITHYVSDDRKFSNIKCLKVNLTKPNLKCLHCLSLQKKQG